jgi:hypothetical protein
MLCERERHAADGEDQPGVKDARDQRRRGANGQQQADIVGIDVPFRPQRRQIDHQEIERCDGHNARQHHGGKARSLSKRAMGMKSPGSCGLALMGAGLIRSATDHARGCGGEPDGEQKPRGRQGRRAAQPSHDEGPKSLADRGGDHVIAERGFPAAPATRPYRQHLMAGHAEHVAEAQKHAEAEQVQGGSRPSPKADAGDEDEQRAGPRRLGVVAAIDPAANPQRREHRDDGEAGGDDAEPEHGKAQFDRTVRGGDADDEDQRLRQCDVDEERNEQAIVEVAPWDDARARLPTHRRIVSPARA